MIGVAASGAFPEARILRHDARRREARKNEPVSAVAKPALQEIHLEKARRGLEENRGRRAAPSVVVVLIGPPAAVPVELLEVLIERVVGVMKQSPVQFSRAARDFDVLVHLARVVPVLPFEEAHRMIAFPTPPAVLDLA